MSFELVHMKIFDNNDTLNLNNVLFSSKNVGNRPFYIYVFFVYNKLLEEQVEKMSEKEVRSLFNGRAGFLDGNSKEKTNANVVFYKIELIPNIVRNMVIDKIFYKQSPVKIFIYVDIVDTNAKPIATKMIKFDGSIQSIDELSKFIF